MKRRSASTWAGWYLERHQGVLMEDKHLRPLSLPESKWKISVWQEMPFISVTHPHCPSSQLNIWSHVKEVFHTSPERPTSLLCPGTSDLPSKDGKDETEESPQDNAEDDRHWKSRTACGRAAGTAWMETKGKQVENHMSQRAPRLQLLAVPMRAGWGRTPDALLRILFKQIKFSSSGLWHEVFLYERCGKCFLMSWNKLLFYLLSIRDIKLSFDGRKKKERKNLPALVGGVVVSVTPAKGRWVHIKEEASVKNRETIFI